ncbi:protein-disulfide reductase DsbD [Cardiobacteriaceae bacterium TAE3-ERU3]|nr:protein-disulfide reductase DsbD [Cardiobacteriaceae bacterium TAE3-ERU3]
MIRKLGRLLPLLACVLVLNAFADPIPVKQAFIPSITTATEPDGALRYDITIDFAPHYYLYADRTSLSHDGEQLSGDATPTSTKSDPYFGDVKVWATPPTLTVNSDTPLDSITLRTQGCEDGVICYPPTEWTLTPPTAAPATQSNASANSQGGSLNALFGAKQGTTSGAAAAQNRAPVSSNGDDILPIEAAFVTEVTPDQQISITMPDGYYVYKDSLTLSNAGQDLTSRTQFPAAESHEDPFRGAQDVYHGQLILTPPELPEYPATITLSLQGCAEGKICYPPDSRELLLNASTPIAGTNAAAATPANTASTALASNSDDSDIAAKLAANYWTTLPLIFLLGIALSFTACIYPLIPIVTSLVVGKNSTTGRSYGLIGIYVLFMGLAMAALGAIFGLFQINLQVVLQTPWITALVAAFFALLALSLFDVFTLQAPAWLQTHIDKLNRRQQSGSFIGAAVMGALSVLVVSPCATPVLTALLLFSAQTTPFKGALALFLFGIGTGLPLLLFAGALRRFMPRAGTWMNVIKKGFAFALLAIAVWLVARILPTGWALLIWAGYSVLFASFVFPLEGISVRFARMRFALASAALIAALLLGQRATNDLLGNPHNAAAVQAEHASFTMVNDATTVSEIISASDKPVILDFYADWCIACKVWERDIWTNAAFATPLADYTLLKVDVTDFTDKHKQLFQELNLVGPPAVLIYPPHGDFTQPEQRIIGEIPADSFMQILAKNANPSD